MKQANYIKLKEFFSKTKKSLIKINDYLQKAALASKKKCPKCDSINLKTLKVSGWKHDQEMVMQSLTLGIRKPTQPLNVCRDCGFSWEDR